MRAIKQPSLFLLLLLHLCVALPLGAAQANTDASDQAKRQRAVALFGRGKRLEALPLLAELVQKNPQDAELLVALAASLIDHAATLTDQEAAAKERFRARDLVERAWELGNTSPLAENLRQLLGELPPNGVIKFSDNPAVEQVMSAGEAAFARRDFDEALKDYAKALELEPTNYSAALFTANTYDRTNDCAQASEWYERAMQLDPNIETAYRYYADMLARQGDMAKARSMLIHAAVAEPYNKIVWRELNAWATINHTAINKLLVIIGLPRKDGQTVGTKSDPKQPTDANTAWQQAYWSLRENWRHGDAFKKHYPQEAEYRHSLAEESEALEAAAQAGEKLKNETKNRESAAADPYLDLLLKLHHADLIEPYVLFSLGDDGIAKDYIPYRAKNRDKLEAYMDTFVVPPAPARP